MPRKAISARARFEIFKRDLFTCQYCGAHPPDAVLHVDHIKAIFLGGNNEEENLITSCQLCNQGKSSGEILFLPQHHALVSARSESLDQTAYHILIQLYPTMTGNSDRWQEIRRFLVYLEPDEVSEAMEAMCTIFNDFCPDDIFLRFKNHCWGKIEIIEGLWRESVQ